MNTNKPYSYSLKIRNSFALSNKSESLQHFANAPMKNKSSKFNPPPASPGHNSDMRHGFFIPFSPTILIQSLAEIILDKIQICLELLELPGLRAWALKKLFLKLEKKTFPQKIWPLKLEGGGGGKN